MEQEKPNKCTLEYIPKHLHWDDKPIHNDFSIEEKLYWRCSPEALDNPYASISLYEISVNRSGTQENPFSEKDDVLYNIEANKEEKYRDKIAITLLIKKIGLHKSEKIIQYPEETPDYKAIIRLVHDPLNCNYAHSLLRILYEDSVVTKENYKKSFGARKLKNLRKTCRDELHKMLVSREIYFDED